MSISALMEGQRLISEAEAAERLATIVSYRPDKARLLSQAAQLRDKAAQLAKLRRETTRDRSWKWRFL